MSFFEKLKHFTYAGSTFAKSDQQTEEDKFIKFYRNLLSEIASHIDYEHDLTNTIGNQSKVLKPFQLEEYADRINDFFSKLAHCKKKKGLDEATVANLFYMILVLPTKEQPAVSKDIRRRLFSQLVIRYAAYTKRQPAELLKALYERLKHGHGSIFGTETEELMEMLRSAATHIDVELRTAETADKILTTEELRKIVYATLRLKNDKQGRKLMSPILDLNFFVTGIARIVCAFLLVVYSKPIELFLFQNLPTFFHDIFFAVMVQGTAFVLILWTLTSSIKYGIYLSRRHVYKRLNVIIN